MASQSSPVVPPGRGEGRDSWIWPCCCSPLTCSQHHQIGLAHVCNSIQVAGLKLSMLPVSVFTDSTSTLLDPVLQLTSAIKS